MTTPVYIKRAMADYIQAALADVTGLSAVALYIRGGTPMPVPSNQYPFVEILITDEAGEGRLTGNITQRIYSGLITVNVQVTVGASSDWLTPIDDEDGSYCTSPSVDTVEELVAAILGELQQEAHSSMGALTVDAETVTGFALDDRVVYGLDNRTNNYENYGSVPFTVQTERRRT